MKLLTVRGKDFGCFPEIEQDLHEQGLVYVVGRNLDTDAASSNGSGKSTIYKLVSWTLFGQTVDGLKGDEVIRHGAKKAVGKLDLSDGYTIRRTRSKGKPKLELLKKNGNPLDLSKEEVQKQIEKWVGVDFKTFRNSVLYGQGDAARFATPATKDGERKDMLHRIMDTEILKTCHRLALDRKNKVEKEIQRGEHEYSNVTERLEEIDLVTLDSRAADWEDEREERAETHQAEAATLLEQVKTKKEVADQVPTLARKLGKLETERAQAVEADAVGTKEIEALTAEVDTARKQWEETSRELAELEGGAEQLAEQIVSAEKSAGDVVELSEELGAREGDQHVLEEAVARCDTELASLEDTIKGLRGEDSTVSSNLAETETKAERYSDELKRLDGDRCPTCTSPLAEGVAAEYISELLQKRGRYNEAVIKLSMSQKKITQRIEYAQETLSKVKKKAPIQRTAKEKMVERVGGLRASLASAQDASKQLDELRDELSASKGRGEVLRLALEELEQSGKERKETLETAEAKAKLRLQAERKRADALSAIREELAGARAAAESAEQLKTQVERELQRMQEVEEEVNPWSTALAEAEAKAAEHKARLVELEKELRGLEHELAHVVFWTRGFGNEGLPSYVLDSVMPYITERTNHYLGTLTDGDISMAFRTQRELKSRSGVKDEISIYWMIEGNEMVPPSGGQQRKMEIACDLALMDLVASREGLDLDLMLLDEVLDGLDREGRTRVLELLGELRRRRGSVFVISHESDLAEEFERVAVVTKQGGAARLEMVK